MFLELFYVHAVSTWNILSFSISKSILLGPRSNFSFSCKPFLTTSAWRNLFSVLWSSNWIMSVHSLVLAFAHILWCLCSCHWPALVLDDCSTFCIFAFSPQLSTWGQRPCQRPSTVSYITGTWYLLIWGAGLCGGIGGQAFEILVFLWSFKGPGGS